MPAAQGFGRTSSQRPGVHARIARPGVLGSRNPHYRFWGEVVRWMAYQRNMAKGETMRLYYSPDQPQVRQTLSLSANVMERNGEPLSKGDVTARIVAPSGKIETVRFTAAGDEWGL